MKNILKTILLLFTITNIYSQVPVTPSDASTGVSQATGSVTWTDFNDGNGNGTYDVEFDDDIAFGSIDASLTNSALTTLALPALLFNTPYYWRVRDTDIDGLGGDGVWHTYSFTTEIATPVLTAPANAATGVSTSPNLSWTLADGTSGVTFDLEYDTDGSFPGTIVAGVTSPYLFAGLTNNTDYIWRIIAKKAGEADKLSASRTFTTEIAIPVLTGPANAALDITIPASLTWTLAGGTSGVTYDLEYDTDGSFPGTIVAGVTSAYSFGGLINNTNYIWRIIAKKAGEADKVSTSRTFTTELGVPVLTAPVNTSINQSTTPTFSWTIPGSTTGIVYNLQYHTGGGFPGTTVSNVTSGYNGATLTGNTLYTWRVVATKPSFTSKNAAAFTFTTRPAPVLLTPADLSSGVTITPNFTWSWPGGGAPTYTIEIAEDLAFTNIVYGPFAATSPHLLPDVNALENGTIYYWRVTATLPGPVTSSTIGKFSTMPQGLSILSSPVNASTISGNIINFRWSAPTTGLQYRVELDDNSDFLSQVAGFPSTLSSFNYYNLQYTLTSLPAGTYFWRVKTFTGAGVLVSISATWNFIIPGPPTAIPIYPSNGAIIYTLYPTIYWHLNNNFNNTPAYSRIRYGTSSGVYTQTSVPTLNNYMLLSGVDIANTYYYVIDVSPDLTFTTFTTSSEATFAILFASLANVPLYQTFPITGTTVYSLTPTLYWFLGLHLPGLTFDLQIDSEPTFSLPRIADETGLTNLNYVSPLLVGGNTYWWRVRINGISNPWFIQSFGVDLNAINTSNNAAVIPTPTTPTAGVVIYTQSPTLQWLALSNQALEFQVVWSNNPLLNLGVLANTTPPNGGQSGWLVTPEYNVPGLLAGTTYYWQVRSRLASNPGTVSNYSSVAQFTVHPGASPVVVLPANPIVGANINSTTASLSWIVPAQSTSTISYNLEISPNKDLSNATIVKNLQNSTYRVDGLAKNSTYYWRVQSTTGIGEKSEYSYVGEFSTGVTTDVEVTEELPTEHSLSQNYPNPFNPSTVITFTVPQNVFATLKIYDMLGQEIRTLVNNEVNSGVHSITWNGENNYGSKVTSGTYIYKLTAGSYISIKKMVLIK